MDVTTIGLDLAKNVFQLHGVDVHGKVILKKKVSRANLLATLANLGPALVGMEACAGAHYWAREIEKLGHQARLMNPKFVAPYIKNQKNDANDAEGICEAVSRPNMRFVPHKSIAQQDLQSFHRARELLIRHRTALANQIRGLLAEYGIVIPQGLGHLQKELPIILASKPDKLSNDGLEMFSLMYEHFKQIQDNIEKIERKIKAVFDVSEECQRLDKIKGIGVMVATALISAAGNAREFKNGRQFAAWLGLVPRQNSSGGKTRLLGITKQGNVYLRCLLIHGARSALYWATKGDSPLSRWLIGLEHRVGKNRAAVALANKNARIAWALLAKGVPFDERLAYQPAR